MFNIHKKEIEWGGRKLTLETGKIARQADGAVMVTYGETMVLCTAVVEKEARPDADFFPLTVHYQEKTYAAGRIPGGFFKREGRPSEKETLTSRLIDRPIRPLFPNGFKNEVQVVCTVVSHDLENDPEVPAMIGASAALALSGAPFLGPLGAARVGLVNNQYVLNPTLQETAESSLELSLAGTDEGVLMVESEAKALTEEQMLEAVMFGHEAYQPVIELVKEFTKVAGKEPWELPDVSEHKSIIFNKVSEVAREGLEEAYAEVVKATRRDKIQLVKEEVKAAFAEAEDISHVEISQAFKALEAQIVRGSIFKTGVRIDGRNVDEVRPITCELGILPRAHGSALFTRGETQALVVTTLGTGDDEQIIDKLEGESRQKFLLHYNFPPYSVGETGRLGTPGRREIGHGKLAWRAIHPELPSVENFPYTMRVVSEITESNGSSSMASVCGTSLSMMDAGVPLDQHVSGIAMGLVKEGDEFVVLTDILGDEDALGDMDFKVAGTKEGITALQMDIKITSINQEIMAVALDQAKEGRLHIIGEMEKAIRGSRETVNKNAPRIESLVIPVDKIREVIGSGGKVIREICETCNVKIDIEDDGKVQVAAVDENSILKALEWIRNIVEEPEVGEVYEGTVNRIEDYGAFVGFLGSTGLVHISQIAKDRVEKVSDYLSIGDTVSVKVIGIDDRGKVKLSIKQTIED